MRGVIFRFTLQLEKLRMRHVEVHFLRVVERNGENRIDAASRVNEWKNNSTWLAITFFVVVNVDIS